VIKVRIYTTDITRWEEIASVMGPTFATTRPANLLVEVSRLVDDALVEIEAEAWVG
jgi:enamine deaminase RidA (YjgF/YER057c/UK114 family)